MDCSPEKPPILYKYRAFNSNTLSCLVRNVIWFASPATFNDPFDGWLALPKSDETPASNATFIVDLPTMSLEGTPNQSITHESDDESTRSAVERLHLGSLPFQVLKNTEAKLKHRGVFCVNTDPKNILMWSHYADQHRGLCIGYRFDYEKFTDIAYIKKVDYPESDDLDVLTENDLDYTDSAVNKLLTKKSMLWVYEDEWRFILRQTLSTDEKGCAQPLPPYGQVEEIIFGMRMRADDRDVIAKLVPTNVALKVAHAAYRRYQVNILGYRGK